MNAALVVSAAFPRHKVKNLARALDCSERQARRIIETGSVPEALQAKFLEFAESTLGAFAMLLGVIREKRREIAYRRQAAGRSRVDRAPHRTRADKAERQASQAEIDFLRE